MSDKTSQALDANYIMAIVELANTEIEKVMKYLNDHGDNLPNQDEIISSLNETCCRLEIAHQVAEMALLPPSPQLELAI